MGVNAIRVTHNPASDELLQVCDELGLMVIEEAFDSWFLGKKSYDYGVRFFEMEATDPTATPGQTWAEFDLKTMVNRGKNFPSIIMWSLGNEIYATDNARGPETAQKLYDWAKEIDDTRPCTMGEDKFRERSATDTTSTSVSYTHPDVYTRQGENVSPEELENRISEDPLVAEVLVYEEDGQITAEIYPNEEYAAKKRIKDVQAELSARVDAMNRALPMFKQVRRIKLRETEFEKTTSRKIKRHYGTASSK